MARLRFLARMLRWDDLQTMRSRGRNRPLGFPEEREDLSKEAIRAEANLVVPTGKTTFQLREPRRDEALHFQEFQSGPLPKNSTADHRQTN